MTRRLFDQIADTTVWLSGVEGAQLIRVDYEEDVGDPDTPVRAIGILRVLVPETYLRDAASYTTTVVDTRTCGADFRLVVAVDSQPAGWPR